MAPLLNFSREKDQNQEILCVQYEGYCRAANQTEIFRKVFTMANNFACSSLKISLCIFVLKYKLK